VIASASDPHDGVGATSDASINGQIEALVRGEPLLDDVPIAVSTQDATVTLFGTVTSIQIAQLAGVLAAEVEGVRELINRLRVVDDG
jgi:osmotically-inducible protein OsmY